MAERIIREMLIKAEGIDYAARKSVSERGDNRFNQRFPNTLKSINAVWVTILYSFLFMIMRIIIN